MNRTFFGGLLATLIAGFNDPDSREEGCPLHLDTFTISVVALFCGFLLIIMMTLILDLGGANSLYSDPYWQGGEERMWPVFLSLSPSCLPLFYSILEHQSACSAKDHIILKFAYWLALAVCGLPLILIFVGLCLYFAFEAVDVCRYSRRNRQRRLLLGRPELH